jgi:hypothetical protein
VEATKRKEEKRKKPKPEEHQYIVSYGGSLLNGVNDDGGLQRAVRLNSDGWMCSAQARRTNW